MLRSSLGPKGLDNHYLQTWRPYYAPKKKQTYDDNCESESLFLSAYITLYSWIYKQRRIIYPNNNNNILRIVNVVVSFLDHVSPWHILPDHKSTLIHMPVYQKSPRRREKPLDRRRYSRCVLVDNDYGAMVMLAKKMTKPNHHIYLPEPNHSLLLTCSWKFKDRKMYSKITKYCRPIEK